MLYLKSLALLTYLLTNLVICKETSLNDFDSGEQISDLDGIFYVLKKIGDLKEPLFERDTRMSRYFGTSYEESGEKNDQDKYYRSIDSSMRGMPRIGRSMPRMGRGMPRIGGSMQRMGRGMPRIGRSMPRMGRGMPRIGRSMPRMGRGMPRIGRSMPRMGRGMPRMG